MKFATLGRLGLSRNRGQVSAVFTSTVRTVPQIFDDIHGLGLHRFSNDAVRCTDKGCAGHG